MHTSINSTIALMISEG